MSLSVLDELTRPRPGTGIRYLPVVNWGFISPKASLPLAKTNTRAPIMGQGCN